MASLPLAIADHVLWRDPAPPLPQPPPVRIPAVPAFVADDDDRTPGGKVRYRTVWISDVHLGTPGCNADLLLDFRDDGMERMAVVGISWQRLRVGDELTTL